MIALPALFALFFAQDKPDPDLERQAEVAVDVFRARYKSAAESDRVSAVTELGKVRHPKTLSALTSLLVTDGPAVRTAAAQALSAFTSHRRQAGAALVGAVAPNEKNRDVQVALLESLGALKETSILPLLHRSFEDKEVRIARAAVDAAGAIGHAASVEPLIALLAKYEKVQESDKGGALETESSGVKTLKTEDSDNSTRNRARLLLPAATTSLQQITRQEIIASSDWKAWWAQNRETFQKKALEAK